MRAQWPLISLPLLFVATGCASHQEPPGVDTSATSSLSTPAPSVATPTPSKSSATSRAPEQLSASATCEQLAGSQGALAFDVVEFAVSFYQEEIAGDEVVQGAKRLVEKGDALREIAHPDYIENLDSLMKEPEALGRIARSGGGEYTLPMQEIAMAALDVATRCYDNEEDLNTFAETLTPILSRIPEFSAQDVEDAALPHSPGTTKESAKESAAPTKSTPTPTPSSTPGPAKKEDPSASVSASASAPDGAEVPQEFRSALNKAHEYEQMMHMSKMSIYNQLVSEYGEQFTPAAAQYAIDNMTGIDWKENALAKAQEYQRMMNMSPAAIYDQLVSEYGEEFTAEEAQYAVDNLTP